MGRYFKRDQLQLKGCDRYLQYRPRLCQWVVDDELNQASDTNFACIGTPDGCFPDGPRVWCVVHPLDSTENFVEHIVTIQVLSSPDMGAAKERPQALRLRSVGLSCCACAPPKNMFTKPDGGLPNPNGVLAKFCLDNLPLKDGKGLPLVQVRGSRSIVLRMIRLNPPLTDSQAVGALGTHLHTTYSLLF